MIELNSYTKQGERVLTKSISGSRVLLHLDQGSYYTLNEVGNRIWELCDGSRNVSEVISCICDEYDAQPETIEADVLEMLRDLAYDNLVVEIHKKD